MTGEFTFWRRVPDYYRERGPEQLVFYNDAGNPGDTVDVSGTIRSIWHPQLGAIREVDTGGDNYRIVLADGTYLSVDQEDRAGWVGDSWAFDESGAAVPRRPPSVQSWRMTVEFD